MSKRSHALLSMPPVVLAQFQQLGENLMIARKRKAWAQRVGVSEPTLGRMERGDPSVSLGAYASALWLLGRAQAIAELAAQQFDLGALESEIWVASHERA